MSSVAVIDYGIGNLHSIAKALQHASPENEVCVTSSPEAIMNADRVVFPGVGAIRDCMMALNQSGLADIIKAVALTKPFLGICLGMQNLNVALGGSLYQDIPSEIYGVRYVEDVLEFPN